MKILTKIELGQERFFNTNSFVIKTSSKRYLYFSLDQSMMSHHLKTLILNLRTNICESFYTYKRESGLQVVGSRFSAGNSDDFFGKSLKLFLVLSSTFFQF